MKKSIFSLALIHAFSTYHAQSVSFTQAPGSPFTNFNSQRGITSKDINGDNIKDLLIANPNNNSINIFLGAGNGQFSNAPQSPMYVNGPIYIAISDLNNDGFQDLATANYYSNSVSILLGNGTGVFSNALGSPITTGLFPYCVSASDVNLDGNMDLVTTSVNSNDIHVLIGNGAGSFTIASGSPIAAGGMPYHVSTGFFNNDNFPDFAIANGSGNTVSVYMGNGNGTFGTPASYAVGMLPRTISVKDLNNDTYLDLVIANFNSNNLHVLMGSLNGTFSNASGSPITVGQGPYQTAIADFDMNGSFDIAVTNNISNNVMLLSGNTNGTFSSFTGSPINVGNGPQPLCTEDFDGDLVPDLALGDWLGSSINVLINGAVVPCNLQASFTSSANVAGSFTFNSTSTGTVAGTTYSWNFGDGSPLATGASSIHAYPNSGSYTVTLTANNNFTPACTQSFTQAITVACNLLPGFTYTTNGAGSFTFNSTSTGSFAPTTYTWNYGDGSPAGNGPSSTHIYTTSGTYIVSLLASNNSTPACSRTYTQSVSVETVITALNSLPRDKKIGVWPNPTAGIVQVSGVDPGTRTELVLYNLLGQEEKRWPLSQPVNQLNLEFLGNGIYLYRIVQHEKYLAAGRIVLNK